MKTKMSVDLTSRETQIIELVIQGARNKDICDLLCISENTVKTHLQNIYSKLDVNSKAKLVTMRLLIGVVFKEGLILNSQFSMEFK